jgi:hypothetical protein
MESAVCRCSDLIRIASAPRPKVSNYGSAKIRNTASPALGLRAQPRPPGTEFLDAETKPEMVIQPRECLQRPKSGKWETENPRRNALFDVVPETRGRPTTQSSNRSPPAPGTEISSPETGRQKPAQQLAETNSETHRKRESPDSRARTARLLEKVQTLRLGGGCIRVRT